MRVQGRLLEAVALAVVVAGPLIVAPHANALPVGYNEDPARLVAVPSVVDRSNTQIARVAFLWPAIEPAEDELNWDEVDRVVGLLHQLHVRPLITVVGSPPWAGAGTPGIQCACDRAMDLQWQQLWQQVALRYPDAILNIWNEPNIDDYGNVSVDRMAELVNEAAAAIWQVAPGRTVVGPPMAPVGNWIPYAGALYRKLDPRVQLAANLYPRGHLVDNLRAELGAVRRIARKRPVWITETNVSRIDVSLGRQKAYVRQVYELAKRKKVAGLIFHRLWSPFQEGEFKAAGGLFSWDAGMSALAPNGHPGALYNAIGRLHRGFKPFVPEIAVDGTTTSVVVEPPPQPELSSYWTLPEVCSE